MAVEALANGIWMISKPTVEELEHFSPYQRDLIERIWPLLGRINPARLGEGSLAEITRQSGDWSIHIAIISSNDFIPGLFLSATPDQCILSVAESEIIECHQDPDKAQGLVGEVTTAVKRYLAGTTVLSCYNHKRQLIRRDYYFGINTENDPESGIGSSTWPLVFSKKIHHTEKHSFSFFEAETGTA